MNPTIYWPDKSLPVEIYCAPEVLKGLDMMATDGLLAMPRIGLGVGGLLLGRRVNRRIDIVKAVEIPCSHTFGPAFVLTPEEIAASAGLRTPEPEPEKAANGDADCNVVGWYCSKPSWPQDMPPVLTDHDRALSDALCPEPWQAVLLVLPSKGKLTTAVFGFRGTGQQGHGLLLGTLRELASAVKSPEVTDAAPGRDVPSADEPATVQDPDSVEAPIVEAPVIPVAMVPVGTLFGTRLSTREPEGEERKLRKWQRLALFAVVVLAMLSAVVFFTQAYWLPHPQVAMVGVSDRTGRVSFMWNSEALSEQLTATLIIDDGPGPLHTIHLTEKELRAGFFQFDCRPGRVTGTLLAGDASDWVPVTARAEIYLPGSGISK